MQLEIPDRLAKEAGCSERDLQFGLVVGLYLEGRLSLGQSSDALGVSKEQFMRELSVRGLPVAYGEEEARRDAETVARLWPRG